MPDEPPIPGTLRVLPDSAAGPTSAKDAPSDAPVRLGFDLTPGDPEGEAPPEPGVRVRRGGCLCGAVRFELRGEPKVVGLCHCGDCRKATGGTALHSGNWPLGAVAIGGTLASFAGRGFCPTCGGRVVHLSAHEAEVNLGALDEAPSGLVPTREGWTIRREPWVAPVPGAEQFERMGGVTFMSPLQRSFRIDRPAVKQ